MQFKVQFSVNLNMCSEKYSKVEVEAITVSLLEAWHWLYITTPANHSAGKIFPFAYYC